MADSPSRSEARHGTPRWVKVLGVVALVAVVLLVVVALAGGGSHGPGRHLGGADQRVPSGPVHTPPAGGHR